MFKKIWGMSSDHKYMTVTEEAVSRVYNIAKSIIALVFKRKYFNYSQSTLAYIVVLNRERSRCKGKVQLLFKLPRLLYGLNILYLGSIISHKLIPTSDIRQLLLGKIYI